MQIDARSLELKQLFSNDNVYYVPDYQRPYSWTKDEIEDLLMDLNDTIQNNKKHYFGAMVFNSKEKNKISIIDGQQRLITVSILLYVIKYFYNKLQGEIKDTKILDTLRHRITTISNYVEKKDNDGNVTGIRIIPGEFNKEFYEAYIVDLWKEDSNSQNRIKVINDFKSKNKFDQTKNVYMAFKYLFEILNDEFAELKDNEKFLNKLKQYQDKLLDNFEVVKIEVGDESDAFKIFETLNDRGLELSSADLIKNYLYSLCSNLNNNDFEKAKKFWIDMVNNSDDISIILKFIRHYWIAFYEDVSKDNLYDQIKEKVRDASAAIELLENLSISINRYMKLVRPSKESFKDNKIQYYLNEMNSMNFDLANPILLKALTLLDSNKINEENFYKTLKLCLNFLIRYIVVMKEKPSKIEKKIGELARILNNEDDIKSLASTFIQYAPDEKFKDIIKTISLKDRSDSTYFILKEIERYFRKQKNTEDWISPGRNNVTIEHILPKIIKNTEWENIYSEEEHEIYLNRLGNLTLLGDKLNKTNDSFDKKKKNYQKSTIKMTQELTKYNLWRKDEIEQRQKEIAEVISDIFSLVDK